MNATFEIDVRIITGPKYYSHYWSWKSNKSIFKDIGFNVYENEPESSVNVVAFPTNICFSY